MSTIANKDIVDSLAHAYLNDSVDANPGLAFYIGQPVEAVISAFNGADERGNYLKSVEMGSQAAAALPTLQAQVDALSTKVNELVASNDLKDQRIADLQKQVPGSTDVEQPVVTPPTQSKSFWDVLKDFFSQFKKG